MKHLKIVKNFKQLPYNFWVGFIITIFIISISLISIIWTPHDITILNIQARLKLPGDNIYYLGTDHFGRDIISMLMLGAKTSLFVAFTATFAGIALGVPLGLLAASKAGNYLDEIIMRGNDLIFAFPALVIAILIAAILGPSITNAIIAIGIFNIPVFARITRGAALSIFTLDFIMAARVCGKNYFQICIEHVLPNISSILIVPVSYTHLTLPTKRIV